MGSPLGVQAMRSRFGHSAYEDPIAEIKKLKQASSLQDYLKSFDMLLDKTQLGEEQALSCFLARLKQDMEMVVRMFNPKTLQKAYSLAKLQDIIKSDLQCMARVKGSLTTTNVAQHHFRQ